MAKMSAEERTERTRQHRERFDLLQPFLEQGVTVSHTVCMGILKEHVLIDIEQFGPGEIGMVWLVGYPTGDTMRIDGDAFAMCDDIAPLNVTHVNRVPIDCLEVIGKRAQTPFQLIDATITDVTAETFAKMHPESCEKCGQPIDEVPF